MIRDVSINPDTIVVRLNRIARVLRTHARLHDRSASGLQHAMGLAIYEIESLVHEMAEPDRETTANAREAVHSFADLNEWRMRLYDELEGDADALLTWWRNGFPGTPEDAL